MKARIRCGRCADANGDDGRVLAEDCPHALDRCRNESRGCNGIPDEPDGLCPDCLRGGGAEDQDDTDPDGDYLR